MVTPSDLIKEINAGKFRPAYYFYGAEDYRISEAVKYVSHKYLPDRQMVTNCRKLDAKRTPLADLMAELAQMPMLGERLVVIVYNFQHYKPKQIEQVVKLLTPADPSRVVIFSSPSHYAPKKNSAFVKNLESSGVETIEFGRLTQRQVVAQITGSLNKAALKIEPQALEFLAGLVSGNRGGLDTEVSKLINYKGEGATVTLDDIRHICSGYEVYNVFELADRMVEGQTQLVLKMIAGLLSEGQSGAAISTLLQGHFISLYLVKEGKQPMGNRGWMTPRLRSQAARFKTEQLEQILIDLAELDADLRRSDLAPKALLEQAALKLCQRN
ncbi:MAG TPA: DNA polymerase III subunit delta [candidate division Zixibacteria bacterium]|nr:DNA polymerase III subunit delta [candidate division Zixibacteria bacterium]